MKPTRRRNRDSNRNEKHGNNLSPGRLRLSVMSFCAAVSAVYCRGPFTHLLTRTGLTATQLEPGASQFDVRVETA